MLVAARWVHFSSMVAVFGSALFWLYVEPGRTVVASNGWPRSMRLTMALLRFAAPCAALSGFAWLVATIANMTGDFAGVRDEETLHAFFFETPFGSLAIARLVLLAALVTIAFVSLRAHRRFVALALVSALLLVSQAWLGHAAEGGATLEGASMIASYAVHVLAGAAWVGGLLPLFLTIIEQQTGDNPRAGILWLLSRYSAMAVAAVGLILVSGLANTAFRTGGAVGSLLASTYGDVLLGKVGLVAVMLGLAAFNRFVLMGRFRMPPAQNTLDVNRSLRASLVAECMLGVLVLGAAALLGVTPPPR